MKLEQTSLDLVTTGQLMRQTVQMVIKEIRTTFKEIRGERQGQSASVSECTIHCQSGVKWKMTEKTPLLKVDH